MPPITKALLHPRLRLALGSPGLSFRTLHACLPRSTVAPHSAFTAPRMAANGPSMNPTFKLSAHQARQYSSDPAVAAKDTADVESAAEPATETESAAEPATETESAATPETEATPAESEAEPVVSKNSLPLGISKERQDKIEAYLQEKKEVNIKFDQRLVELKAQFEAAKDAGDFGEMEKIREERSVHHEEMTKRSEANRLRREAARKMMGEKDAAGVSGDSQTPADPLDAFFVTYNKFDYNPKAESWAELKRLSEHLGFTKWPMNKKSSTYRQFRHALSASFKALFGTDVANLEALGRLCELAQISPVPETAEERQLVSNPPRLSTNGY